MQMFNSDDRCDLRRENTLGYGGESLSAYAYEHLGKERGQGWI
jgi:hypothetical protein